MKKLFLFPLVTLLLVPYINVYADHALLVTNQTSYKRGDVVEVSGVIGQYITSSISAEIRVIDASGFSVFDKNFNTDEHGKIDVLLNTDNWNRSGTYKIFCTNCDHGIYFSFDASNYVPKNIQPTTTSSSSKPAVTTMSDKALTNLYTKLNILQKNNLITNDDIVKVTKYLVSVGYTDEITLGPIILKVENSLEVMKNSPTFTTQIHSCTHIESASTVYVGGFVTNNKNYPLTVIFKFEILDKNNNVLNFKESEIHQISPHTEWDATDYVAYDPMFDHCDIYEEMVK